MIQFYNRKLKQYETEQVAGERYLNWTYSSPVGRTFLELLIKKRLFSKLYGYYCDTKKSSKKIEKFIKTFHMDLSPYEKSLEDFTSFNDFFTRALKPNARETSTSSSVLISPADGKLFAYDKINIDGIIQVKGFTYSLAELIQDTPLANKYNNGTCLVFRLCPTDYHRFHFIDDGHCSKSTFISGKYYSVNPIALQNIKKVFCQNKREWSLLHSVHFGEVLYVEVGATCVGSIVQTYLPDSSIKRGDEKGYFKFGGSTVILFFEPNQVQLDEDILKQTALGFETSVTFGEKIGLKL